MFRFTIRDVLWLTVVVALGAAWWIQNGLMRKAEAVAALANERVAWGTQELRNYGVTVPWPADPPPLPDWEARAKSLASNVGAYGIQVEWESTGYWTRRDLDSFFTPDKAQ